MRVEDLTPEERLEYAIHKKQISIHMLHERNATKARAGYHRDKIEFHNNEIYKLLKIQEADDIIEKLKGIKKDSLKELWGFIDGYPIARHPVEFWYSWGTSIERGQDIWLRKK